ncbi:MAG TPA: DUF1275 family protein [Acidimicrobiales bacterium]|nr:DUF1275 family protein [Acidimicrobiales bacterium]
MTVTRPTHRQAGMSSAVRAALRLVVNDDRHGPLPALLLALTLITGLVDAVSILSLGRVFVANMTGNVVFVGFALAGAPGFSLAASLSALAGFLAGAALAGRLAPRLDKHRGHLLLAGTAIELLCVTAGLILVAAAPTPLPGGVQDAAAAVLAVALGTQNAVVRALAVPDLTTTVLTLTLTGLVADARHGLNPTGLRRLLAVTTMLAGAIAGAVLVLDVSAAAGLGATTAVLLAVVAATAALNRNDHPWQQPAGSGATASPVTPGRR